MLDHKILMVLKNFLQGLSYTFFSQVELLGKKYEEKYKQVADIASKLTVEEANFRHIQVFQITKQTVDFLFPESLHFNL